MDGVCSNALRSQQSICFEKKKESKGPPPKMCDVDATYGSTSHLYHVAGHSFMQDWRCGGFEKFHLEAKKG